jgi:deazaflavin-dependent oxidoreductase (nitroreductase family)
MYGRPEAGLTSTVQPAAFRYWSRQPSVSAMANRTRRRLEGRLFRFLIEQFGVDIDGAWILEVSGRRTGIAHHNPVKPLDVDGERYLVALYGHTDWSRNLRAASSARLRQRGRTVSVAAAELPVEKRPRVLRAYLNAACRRKTIDILGAGSREPGEAHLQAIAADHPVFRITITGEQSHADSAARWAVTSGVAGLISGGFLILFFAFGRPVDGEPTPWSWFGPANDLTSALQAFGLVPVALAVRDLMPGRLVQRWTTIGVVAMSAATVLSVLLVVGVLPFAVQAPLVTFSFAVVFCWLFAISRAGLRAGVLPQSVARAGTLTSLAIGGAAVIGAAGLVLPKGSVVQYAVFAAAGAGAAVAWFGFPVWALRIAGVLKRRTTSAPVMSKVEGGHA